MQRSFKSQGIVLKRRHYGEADRLVTIFTQNYGKLTVLAKGVRRSKSGRRSSVEPATQAQFMFYRKSSLPLLTQASLLNSFPGISAELSQMTKAYQIMEVVDSLTAEEEEMSMVYQLLVEMLGRLSDGTAHKGFLLESFRFLLQELGFTHDKEFSELGLKRYIEELANRQLRSKAYLTVPVR